MRQVRASLGLEQLTFKQIRYFQAIAEAGSFRRAADRLGVTQPTLTVQIATLESTLNTPLFERQRSGVVLTPVARDLLPRARRIAEEIKGFADQAQGISGRALIAWASPRRWGPIYYRACCPRCTDILKTCDSMCARAFPRSSALI